MHIDARTLENDSVIEGDLCIIGAGAAGIALALEWAHSQSKVILLEGGGFEYDERIQELYAGKTSGQRYYPLKSSRLHYFGGTTGHWAGMCSTFDAIDFEKRDWIPLSGWPIRRNILDPFYERAHKLVELGPYEYDLPYWQKKDPELVQLPMDENIVWHKLWQFSPPTRFGEKYRLPIVRSKNIHLYTYANVTEILAEDNLSHITSVSVRNYAGKNHTVKAKCFVLACCSIQNARLLLASNRQVRMGLGNEFDVVGRHFMEHLEISSAELHLRDPNPLKLYSWGRNKVRAELAISAEKQREYQLLNGTVSFTPLETARGRKSMIDIWSDDDPRKNLDSLLGAFRSEGKMEANQAKEHPTAYELFTRIEQAPNPLSRVTLSEQKDELGMPRAELHWELTPLEKRSIRKIYELVGQQIGASGVGRVRLMEYLRDANDFSWPAFTGGGWHHMGTTRMSQDPAHGVVDANCKVHSLSNLFIAGASCFATAAAPNPTLTLLALTLRLSDYLKTVVATLRS